MRFFRRRSRQVIPAPWPQGPERLEFVKSIFKEIKCIRVYLDEYERDGSQAMQHLFEGAFERLGLNYNEFQAVVWTRDQTESRRTRVLAAKQWFADKGVDIFGVDP